MKERVFLDTGIFVAFLNERDQWHQQAAVLFDRPRPHWNTSVLVVSEAYSWFLHRMGEESARTFRTFLSNLSDLRLFAATKRHHADVLRMLDRLRGSKLTYVDASSLCFMEAHDIATAWSTDRHLTLTGARVLPRV